jgi:hypothetical protein
MEKKRKTRILDEQRLITPVFRVAFPNVFEPQAMKGGEPKYSVVMLFPKDADLRALKTAMKAAKVAAFGPDKTKWPEIESPVKDGDVPSSTGEIYEGFAGHYAIKASSNKNSKPGVFDENVNPITDPAQFYPGCYAIAYCFAYVWEFNGRHGVGFILDHLQKQRDGEPFGGRKPGQAIFKPVARTNSIANSIIGDEDDGDDFI